MVREVAGLTEDRAGTVDAAGDLTVEFQSRGGAHWRVAQVTVEMPTAPAGAQCVMRFNGAAVSPLIATLDAAGGDPPVMLRPGDRLAIEWTSCTPDDRGRVFLIYDRLDPTRNP